MATSSFSHPVNAESDHGLLFARTEELERLNGELRDLLAAASHDSKQLRLADTAKDEVLGFIAHELRGPLTTILGNASILLGKRNLEASAVEVALHDIENDAHRLERMITNLLALARPESPMPDEPLDLHDLVSTTVEKHRKDFPVRPVDLAVTKERPLVTAHHDYTEEILINLLSNAEKFSPCEKPIEVRMQKAAGHAEVYVADCGPGIPESEMGAIFQPFYRSPATSKIAPGLGLGLAVSKRLVDLQGGTIWAKPRDGGGSEFGFALPLYGGDA